MASPRKISFEPKSQREHRFSPERCEVVLAYSTGRAALLKRTDASLRAQLEKQLAIPDSSSFSIPTGLGGRTDVLIIEKGISAFNLHTALRRAFGACLASPQTTALSLDLQLLDVNDARRVCEAFVSLASLSGWRPEVFGRRAKEVKPLPDLRCEVISKIPSRELREIARHGLTLAEATNLVRTLSESPPNVLNPAEYRRRIEALAKEQRLKMEFWNTTELKKKGAGAFLAVVQADPDTASGIAHITVPSKNKKPRKRIALVGKGLCFDTGGYNVKTGDYMSGMHRDMTGSAVALALTRVLAELRPDLEVHTYLALAENLISPTAYKPDDVVVASNGLSIEVINTDAEGRMVLSDTLALATQSKPDLVIDFATLTGAAVRSLDTRRSAVFSNRPQLAQLAVKCGDVSGERTWSFPLGEDYKEALKSDVADLKQCSVAHNSDHIYAATFLAEFVNDVPWVHMDLSASKNKGGLGLVSSEATGFGVRWALELIEAWAK